MEDIISHGDDRPPRGGGARRRLLVAGALIVVAAVVLAEHLPRGHQSSASHVAGRSVPVRLRAEGPAVLQPSGIIGDVVPWTAQARVPRTGARPAWFWPAQGRVAPILGLPGDRFGYVFTRVIGGWAIQPASPGSPGCENNDCSPSPGPATPVFYLPDSARRAVLVAKASLVAPAAVPGRIWLTSYPAGADINRTPGLAQQYTGAGTAVGAAVHVPAGYQISQGTTRGLLLVGGLGNSYQLWDPAGRRVLRGFDGVVAASATAIAYEPPCQLTCPMRVLDLSTGRATALALPAASTVTAGRFSPDGRYLALQVSVGNSLGGASAMQLEVAVMPTGQPVMVPHTFVSSDALAGFGWPDGDNLVAEFSFSSRVQMALWAPGGPRLAVADVRRSQRPTALVVG